jgi:hypothetical protein
MDTNGHEWIGMDRNGLEWIGMDWNGLEWIGMEGGPWIAAFKQLGLSSPRSVLIVAVMVWFFPGDFRG